MSISNHTNGLILMRLLNLTSQATRELVILELQMAFQNHGMYLFFLINTANIESQTANPFLYNTFSVSTNPRTLDKCYLEVGNGNEYPDIHYKPSSVFRDVMPYVYANNDFQGGTLLNRQNFENIFAFVYFDLTKQKLDIKDGVTKLAFHYELSGATATNYNIYASVLHEREAEIEQQSGKVLLRA